MANTSAACGGIAGRFSPAHYIKMWRDRLGLTVAEEDAEEEPPPPPPAARQVVDRPLDSLRRHSDDRYRTAARPQTELGSASSSASAAKHTGSRRKKPPPPAPLLKGSLGSRSDGAAGGVNVPPVQRAGQDNLLAAIRGGVAQRAERGVDVSQLEGRLEGRRNSGAGHANAHIAQLSDALSGLRRQIGPRGSESDATESDEQEDDDDGWLSDDGDVPVDATRHHWARPRAFTAPGASAPAAAPAGASAFAPAPTGAARVELPPGIRLSRSQLQNSPSSHPQEPEWLPQRHAVDSNDIGEMEPTCGPTSVQQAQARVLSDPELHAILARRRATTDAHAVIVATPESVTAIGVGGAAPNRDNDRHHLHAVGADAVRMSRSTGRRNGPGAAEDSVTRRNPDPVEPRFSPWKSGGTYSPGGALVAAPLPVQHARCATAVSEVEAAVIGMGFSETTVRRVQADRARLHGGAGYAHADELLSAVLEADEQISGAAPSESSLRRSLGGNRHRLHNTDRYARGANSAHTSHLEQERVGLQRAQLDQELLRVESQIAERQATYNFLMSSVSGHQLHAMAAEMESLLVKKATLESQLAALGPRQGTVTGGASSGATRSEVSLSVTASTSVLVQIPPHVSSGQQLQVTLPDGRPFIFIVPQGVREGQSVELNVPPPDRVLRVDAQPAPPDRSSTRGADSSNEGWKNAAAGTLNRLGERIKSPRGQSEARVQYQRRLQEREATLRTLQSMGENTEVVEREIRAMRAIISAADVDTASDDRGSGRNTGGWDHGDDPELALARAASLSLSESEAAVLMKEQQMLEKAIEASHRSAVDDEVRRKEFLAGQISQLEALLLSERKAERSAEADWPPITRDLRTEYNSHFIHLCGHGGTLSQSTVSAASVMEFLRLSSLSEQTLIAIIELTVPDHRRGVDAEEFMLAMHITQGVTRGLTLPARLPAHLLRGGQRGESERILELEAALASARAEAAAGANPAAGDDQGLREQLQEMEAALAAVRYEKQLLENERAEAPAMGAVMGGGGGGGLTEQEVAALRAKVALLQKQLSDLQTEEDSDEWDGTLESAQAALRAAAERLMEGDESAQPDFDKWDKRISTHPDHLAAEARKLAAWER